MEFREMYRPRGRVTVSTGGETRTKQSFRDECDINSLMRRYARGQELPSGPSMATYGDFTGPAELLEARAIITRAQAQFAGLPADVRERFKNDPARFLAFVMNKDNNEEARKLGLLKEAEKPSAELLELKRIADTVAERLVKQESPAAK